MSGWSCSDTGVAELGECRLAIVSEAGRAALRARLIAAAHGDPQVLAAALLGSAASGTEDRWSDIDLALRLAPGVDPVLTADRWLALVAQTEVVVDHLDLHASGAVYRVLLLGSTLQVDLSFWPHDESLVGGPPVHVVFGEVGVHAAVETPAGEDSLGDVRMAWLYALHVRSALRRGRLWQATWMLEGIRNRLAALYCRRFALPTDEGRGVDRLPTPVLIELAATWPARVDLTSLGHSFESLLDLLIAEAVRQRLEVPAELSQVFAALVRDATSG